MKKSSLIAILLAGSMVTMAIPARRGFVEKTQPDGTTIRVELHGDENFHWMTNEAGEWVEEDENGYYRVVESRSDEEIEQSRSNAPRRVAAATQTATPLNIAPRGLVILVNFSDKKMTTSFDEIEAMINSDNYVRNYSYTYGGKKYNVYSEGSARQYFIDQSYGAYQPHFDVVGPYTLSNTISYYGANNSYGEDVRACDMIVEACQKADADGIDFSQYDCNGDGEIDFVFVIYAGYGEADGGASTTIWPHSYWVKDACNITCKLDGKTLNTYACSNEISATSNKHTGISTFCHEFSHVLGLPDLYTTNNATHKTLGEWDILDAGSYNNEGNTPPAFSAYERFFCGWLKPTVLNSAATIKMEDLKSSKQAYIITSTGNSNLKGNDPNPTEFYILENRQMTGWDEWLPGHGLLITKVKYNYTKWVGNTVNNTASSMGVDIIEADGKAPKNSYGKATDAFPAGAESFCPYEDYPITNIQEGSDGSITFDFMGGSDRITTLALERTNKLVKEGDPKQMIVVAVYDLAGRLLRERADGALALDDLTPGMYIVRTASEEPTADNKRTVKYKATIINIVK